MKKILSASFLLFILAACNNNDKTGSGKSENDVDAARNFIRSALDGKFSEARQYMLQDTANLQFLDVAERNYERAPLETTNSYKGSSINIHQVSAVNDSTTVVVYSNSFKKDHDTLKVLRVNNQWLVDLKYLYQHDMDTTRPVRSNIDTATHSK
jgi:hypothetical protein